MLSSYSEDVTKSLSKDYKARNGIFFTPKSVRDMLWEYIDTRPTKILEPSAGTGEFFDDCRERFPDAIITGVELDADMAKTRGFVNADFLEWQADEVFDLIIGNPPFVQRPRGHKANKNIASGRSNLYVEFIHKCITRHLAPRGTLAFVIPATIGNSAFYEPTRRLLCSLDVVAFKILDAHDFVETSTRVCLLVIRNNPGMGRYVYNGFLCECPEFTSSTKVTVGELDVTFKTGHCHAQVKRHFVPDGSIPFITNRDIGMDAIVFGGKTRYLSEESTKTYSGRALLVKTASAARRGGKFEFGFTMYEGDRWSADNDVIVIRGKDIDVVYGVLKRQYTRDFVKMLSTNGHINMRLLKNIPSDIEQLE
jgi:hypothetical protein